MKDSCFVILSKTSVFLTFQFIKCVFFMYSNLVFLILSFVLLFVEFYYFYSAEIFNSSVSKMVGCTD